MSSEVGFDDGDQMTARIVGAAQARALWKILDWNRVAVRDPVCASRVEMDGGPVFERVISRTDQLLAAPGFERGFDVGQVVGVF